MRIEIWAEITCPWCGLGSHRLDRALEQFEHGDEVEVVHRSFPLTDGFDIPGGGAISVREATMQKTGMSGAQLEAVPRRIEAMAEREGLTPYIVLDNQVGDTWTAHEFLAYATAEGKNRAAWDAMFRAYFGKALPIFDVEILLDLADELGLDRGTTRQVLADGRFREHVRDEAHQAQRLGATGAPFVVFDGRYAVPGAQETDTLLDILRRVWDETHPSVPAPERDAAICGPDGCVTPSGHPHSAHA
ncbi:DsbA family oxidoreductase [Streptomyces ipomoeae]|uniref:DsbA family oxidoreductase n=1 Tax=Streptomyces ipomoeae TaxID=103232 RepID=UPI001147435D|nr:DsbA family oxidoreductase [Streptomyces ipomoeae]MDX2937763.1 DsbA family oxidoreductase [Streptomyces ipomoeae]TQE17232.1 DsbA family oxidoreductase [Streptomyces ipomoeae]